VYCQIMVIRAAPDLDRVGYPVDLVDLFRKSNNSGSGAPLMMIWKFILK